MKFLPNFFLVFFLLFSVFPICYFYKCFYCITQQVHFFFFLSSTITWLADCGPGTTAFEIWVFCAPFWSTSFPLLVFGLCWFCDTWKAMERGTETKTKFKLDFQPKCIPAIWCQLIDWLIILTSAFVTVSATPPFSVVVCPFVKLSVTSFGVIGFPPALM